MPREACRALITDESGKRLLLAKRADHDYRGGMWCALGGKVDPGEKPEAATVREAFEESGLVLSGLKFFDVHRNEDWVTLFYEAHAAGELHLNPDEHSESGYFDENEIEALELAFDHRQIYLNFLRNI